MAKKGGKAPKTPDYSALAKQDADAQRLTAQELTKANRPTQVDAYGNRIDWSQDPTTGQWTQRSTLNDTLRGANENIQGGFNEAMGALRGQGGFEGPINPNYQQMDPRVLDANMQRFNSGSFAPNAGNIGTFTNTAGNIGDFDRTQGDKVAADYYESIMGRARPEQQREQTGLDVQLRLQGLQPGTEAYNRSMANMLRTHGDVATQAGLEATGAGYGAARDIYNTNLAGQGQRFDQSLAGYGANLQGQGQRYDQAAGTYGINKNQQQQAVENAIARENQQMARNTQLQQQQAQRYAQARDRYNIPMERANQYGAMMNSLPGGQFPGFSGATGYNPASMTNAAQSGFEANMGKYSAGQGKKGNTMNAAAGLGSAAILASDETLKTNIEPLEGEAALATLLELGGYEYDWKDGSGHDMGVIAQQVEKVLPELVVRVEEGTLAVKYQGLVALAIEAIKHIAGVTVHG